jgi:hypothetical protein
MLKFANINGRNYCGQNGQSHFGQNEFWTRSFAHYNINKIFIIIVADFDIPFSILTKMTLTK